MIWLQGICINSLWGNDELGTLVVVYVPDEKKKYMVVVIILSYYNRILFFQNCQCFFAYFTKGGVYVDFSDNLRVLRLKKQLTQAELAKLVEVEQSTIARYETGEYKPKIAIATKLAKIFGTTVETLYSGQTE